MMGRRRIVAFLALAVGLACVIFCQSRLDAVREETAGDEVRYLPNDKLLTHFTVGMASVVADLVWIQAVQYTGRHYRGDRDFTWLNHMFDTVTRLDPYFVEAYRYGGMFLSFLKADDGAGIGLLKRGMVYNPRAWELPYEAAITHLLAMRGQSGSREMAARYLALAVETGKAPDYVVHLASVLQAEYDLIDMEREMWEATFKNDDKLLSELATRKLGELALRETCAELSKGVQMYATEHARYPERIEDLVDGKILVALPEDPLGGTFFLGPDMKVRSTTVLDEQVNRARVCLANALDVFKRKNGRWPATLQELVDKGSIDEILPHPYPGREWRYDPKTGAVE